MVPRLRVAVRVVSENEHLTHLAKGPPGPGLYQGEKKFAVVIQNPQQWRIGHLAAEVKRQFKKLYGRDLGTIKYLSHGFDDCELHKDLSVYDHLYDEGRAKADPGDQYVVVKAVFSQGRPLREGSDMPDFDDPRYEHRPIPPVPIPSWSSAPSKPSKRAAEKEDDEQYFGASEHPNAKRQRLVDRDDADSDDDIAQSVEREEAMQGVETTLPPSQTIIQDSQSTPPRELFQPARRSPVPESRSSSFRPSLASTSVTNFLPSRRIKYDQTSESSVDWPIPKHLRFDHNHGNTQALLTPPSDASKNGAIGEKRDVLTQSSKKKPAPTHTTSPRLRRPGMAQQNIYDVEESDDIECSLMSPKSRRASAKKLSRSSSGPKSSPTASRNGEAREVPTTVPGTIPPYKFINLIRDASSIQPKSAKRPRAAVVYGTPEYNFTADEDGYSQQGDVLQEVAEASTNGWHLPGEHVSYAESNDPAACRFTTLALPKSKGWSEGTSDDHLEDTAMQPVTAAASMPKATAMETPFDSEDDTSVAQSKKPILSNQANLTAASKQVAREASPSQPTRRRRRRACTKDDFSTEALNLDTGYARPNTKQYTPVDSPGEQLLEMQASSQKSRQDSQPKTTKKPKRPAKVERKRRAAARDTTKLSPADQQVSEKQSQEPKSVGMLQSVEKPLTLSSEVAEEQSRSQSASKTPYLRPSPPKGSMGLGVTDSPRRRSTLSASGSSSSSRRLFQTELVPAQVAEPVPVPDKKSDSDSENEAEDESSDSGATTPSKQAPKDKPISGGFQRHLVEPKTIAPQQEALAVFGVRTESVVRWERPAVMPKGMTQEQYESIRYGGVVAVPEKSLPMAPKTVKKPKTRTEKALPPKISTKGSTSSVALSARSESPAVPSVTLPQGMTMKKYEEMKEKFENVPSKERKQQDLKVKKELRAKAEQALLVIPSNGGSTSSVAASEEPEAHAKDTRKKAPKTAKPAAVAPVTASASTRKTKSVAKQNIETTAPGAAVRSTIKAKSAPSNADSELIQASQPACSTTKAKSTTSKIGSEPSQPSQVAPKKTTKVKSIPSSTASEASRHCEPEKTKAASTRASSSASSKPSQSLRTKATPAVTTAAAPSAKAQAPTEPADGFLLKKLVKKVADRSARRSPAAPTFAKPVPKSREFKALNEDSDDESESDEDGDEEVEVQRENVVNAAQPDQSTRSRDVDDDEDVDSGSEDEDED